MNGRTLAKYALFGVLGVVLISVLFSVVLGQPVLLTYVETESMEPAIDAGDGYVAIPAPLAGDVEQGDVVAFEAEEVHGGELTTHRVVDERENGYVTQGDNNPFTDQDQGEPPVTDGQVNAVALQVNGEVVTIPHLGTAAMSIGAGIDRAESVLTGSLGTDRLGSGQLTYVLFGFGLVLLLTSVLTGRGGHQREGIDERERTRDGVVDSRRLLAGCVVLICLAATLAMVIPAGTETYGIVSTEGDSVDPTIIPVGETDDFEYEIHNAGFLPTISYIEPDSSGIEVTPEEAKNETSVTTANGDPTSDTGADYERFDVGPGSSVNATVTLQANDETGYHVESMTEHRYLVLLPPSVIEALYEMHPWLPFVAIYAVITAPIVAFWRLFSGSSDRIRIRTRSRSSGILDKLYP